MAQVTTMSPCYKFTKVQYCMCIKCQWRSMCKKCISCINGSNCVTECKNRKTISSK